MPDAAAPPLLVFDRVGLCHPGGRQALQDCSLQLAPGEFLALLGPSGCGKSTLLRLAAGLLAASSGRVQSPALAPGRDGGTAMVFQSPALMPWASVEANVMLPLRLRGRPPAEARAAARAQLAQVGLAGWEAARPAELSGGMAMRVAIARALVQRPRLLLMDEPFAALDELSRQALQGELLAGWQASGCAVLFVTHNVAEAVVLSQRVAVMGRGPGRIVAEHRIDPPPPRAADFRHSDAAAAHARALSAVLAAAPAAGLPA